MVVDPPGNARGSATDGVRDGTALVPILRRDRLIDAAAAARVVLLEAPGGYGKTTLAEAVIAAWEHVGVRARFVPDTDLARGVALVLRGARRAGLVDIVEAVTTADPTSDRPLDALDTFVGALAERAVATTIFLDDVHHLDGAAAAAFAETLRDLPESCRLVVAGRSLGAFATLTATTGAWPLDADALRMDRSEIAQVLDDLASDTLVEEVAVATGGWCAAVGLTVARLRLDPTWSPARADGNRSVLAELVAEVATANPMLRGLAVFPLIDADVAVTIGGDTLWDSALRSGLLQRHYGRWHTVPDPMLEALADAAFETIDGPAETLDRHRVTIARHYHAHGETLAAIAVLTAATSPAPLTEFVARTPWADLEVIGPRELRRVADRIASAHGPLQVEALVTIARAAELPDPSLRIECLARARERCAEALDEHVARTLDAEDARDLVAAADLDRARTRAEAVIATATHQDAIAKARALATIARIDVFACTPESLARGARGYEEAAALFRAAGETRWLSETLARRGYTALYMAGAPIEGAFEMQQALALLPTGDFTRAFWLTNYADLMLYLGRETEADAAVTEALEIGVRRRDSTITMMAWWSRSWLAARRRDLVGCRLALDECERLLGPWVRPGQRAEYHGSSADLLALLGDHEGYVDHRDRGLEVGRRIGYVVPITIAEARHESMFGDAGRALELLDILDASEAVVPSNRPGRLILRALAHARRGEHDRAREIAAHARAAAAAMQVPDLVERLDGPIVDLLEAEVGALAASEATRGVVDPGGPMIRLLGGFSVVHHGRDRTPAAGNPSGLVKLLAIRGVLTTDAAIDALWPDAEIDTGRARLRNLLNRLRDRSGEIVVRAADTLRLADGVTTDLAVFEAAAADALGAAAHERVGLARHGIALFAGELLPGDVYEDWTAGPRERVKRRYLALVDTVADDAIGRGDIDEAIRLLDLGIAAEPLDENRYARMCDALVAQGRLSSAREVAVRAAATLAEIGEVVGPDLAALIRR